jgi:translocation and assembly module TamB
MRRAAKILAWTLGVLVALPVLLVVAVLVIANIDPGRRLIERLTPQLTGDVVRLSGISGRFPGSLRIGKIEVRDKIGAYVTVSDAVLNWSPLALLHGLASVDLLSAGNVTVARLPVSSGSSSSSTFSVPLRVAVRTLRIDQLDIARPVAGVATALAVDGSARIDVLRDLPGIPPQDDAAIKLAIRQRDGSDRYDVDASLAPSLALGGNHAVVTITESQGGLIGKLAALPAIGAIAARLTADGPRDALATTLAITAGGLKADANGTIDAVHQAADLTLSASAPAMAPSPDLSWQSVALDAQVRGPFTKPHARAKLHIDTLAAVGAAIHAIDATVEGDAGAVQLRGSIDGLRLPGPKPDLFQSAPIAVEADARLDTPERPVRFALHHPLLNTEGTARTGGSPSVQATLTLPDLSPFAAAGGIALAGRAALTLHAAQTNGETQVQADGTVGITGGLAPIPGLVGDNATIGAAAVLHGSDITLQRLAVNGRTLQLSAKASLADNKADADADVTLSDLSVLAPRLAGALSVKAHAAGPVDALTAHAELSGHLAARGMESGPLTATLDATGLPNAPSGTLTAQGSLIGAPVDLSLAAKREAGALSLTIDRATWKSLNAGGALSLPAGATIPQGQVHLAMTRLEDLAPLVGQKIAGSLTAALDANAERTKLDMEARGAGLPGTATAGRAVLAVTVTQPATHPVVDATLSIDGIAASGVAGSAKMQVRGPQDALTIRVDANLPVLAGAPASLSGAATVDAAGNTATLSALQAAWKGETLRLLGPARIDFAGGVSVDRLRMGLRQAVLDLSGKVSPTLDLTASLRNLPADIATVFAPDFAADGTLRADARLTGPTAKPSGTVSLAATGLRLRTGPARALPATSITATAALAGGTATIDAAATAGTTRLTVTGRAPMGAGGPLDLRAAGTVDLALLDPILAANARRVRGRLALDATIAGTVAAPALSGTVRLTDGDVQDFAQGLHLTGMTGLLRAQGDTVRIEQFSATAGPGTISAAGTIGVLAPNIPIDVTLTARNARPLSSDLLTAQLNADLTLRGQALGPLAIGGTVLIQRAVIRIPERLPASVPVLNVRLPNAKPLPPPAPAPAIALDVTVNAPEQIFVRGRGLDAELGGRIHLQGTLANLQPSGGFELRRGTFSLAGQTLNFSKGEVTFEGDGLTDPSLDFVANATNGSVLATLEIAGTAKAPKIILSSTPELPQDEVLAELLFGKSASSLGPFELAQIAAALASLTGVAPGAADPLGGVRSALGLDRLSVGTNASGSAALQAGRYVARGVYVGVQQGVSGGSQAQVQVDLLTGLKLQGTVGTGGAPTGSQTIDPSNDPGSSVGLTYQFEY